MSRSTSLSSSSQPSFARRNSSLLAASLLLAAAALTGCTSAPANPSRNSFPSLLGTSHFNGEAISTLGANYTLPPDPHHHGHLRDIHTAAYTRSGHRAL